MVRWTLVLVLLVAIQSAFQWGDLSVQHGKANVIDCLSHAFAAKNVQTLLAAVFIILSNASFEFSSGGRILVFCAVAHVLCLLCMRLVFNAALTCPQPLLSFLAALHVTCVSGSARPASIDRCIPALNIVVTRRFFASMLILLLAARYCTQLIPWSACVLATHLLCRCFHSISHRFSIQFLNTSKAALDDASGRLLQDVGYPFQSEDAANTTAPAAEPSDEALAMLMGLGFDRERCFAALQRSRGNVEEACNSLLDS